MLGLLVGRFKENFRNFVETLLLGKPCKRIIHQRAVEFGARGFFGNEFKFGAFGRAVQTVGLNFFFKDGRRLTAHGATFGRSVACVFVAADSADPFFAAGV